jgi:hypothetical protein
VCWCWRVDTWAAGGNCAPSAPAVPQATIARQKALTTSSVVSVAQAKARKFVSGKARAQHLEWLQTWLDNGDMVRHSGRAG